MSATDTTTAPILRVERLSMRFGGLLAIDDLSFEARRGEITALIGPNGAGKTTVFNCITGFYKPTEGMITLTRRGGEQYLLERLPDFRITQHARVARTFQNIRLFAGMTALENLLVAQHNKLMDASGYTILGLLGIGNYRQAYAEAIDLAKFWLDKAGLMARADDPAGDLPYGAQRRLEIARAMCTGPELLCLDEPAAGLNPRESAALNDLLNEIRSATGASILLIEHDMSVVMGISDHVVVLEYGRKISDGDPASVRSDPKVIAAYLGVDDEEVEEVLIEVGDDAVIEGLDIEPAPEAAAAPAAPPPAPPAAAMPKAAAAEPAAKATRARVRKGEATGAKATEARASGAEAAQQHGAKAAARPAAAPVATAAPAIAGALRAPRGGKADDLTLIKGIGPVNARKLNDHGIFHFDQIAGWKKADVAAAEAYLAFDGRIAREEWIRQARQLAKAGTAPKGGGSKGSRTRGGGAR